MKKFITLILVITTLFTLAACGGTNEEVKPETKNDTLVFKSGSAKIVMNAQADEALNALGQAKSEFKEESCAGLGYEITYKYPGFELVTYQKQDDEPEYIFRVFFTDDTVTTNEGIRLGDDAQKVVDTYACGSASDNKIEVVKGNCTLYFMFENGAVKSIEYMANDAVAN